MDSLLEIENLFRNNLDEKDSQDENVSQVAKSPSDEQFKSEVDCLKDKLLKAQEMIINEWTKKSADQSEIEKLKKLFDKLQSDYEKLKLGQGKKPKVSFADTQKELKDNKECCCQSPIKSVVNSPVYRFVIQNVNKFSNKVTSGSFTQGVKWKISVGPETKEGVKWLAVYVKCQFQGKRDWTGSAQIQVKLMSQAGQDPLVEECPFATFDKKNRSWGSSQFVNWTQLTDPTNGWVDRDDSIELEVEILVENFSFYI